MESDFVQVAGGQLYYEVTGSGDPFVLIHGNAGDRRHWDRLFGSLSPEFRAIRYDVRGYGKSSLPVTDVSYSDYDDLATLMDRLDVSRAHVLGWSFGSGIAVDIAVAHPERVISLIAVGPWVNGYSSPLVNAYIEDAEQLFNEIAAGGPEVAVDAWMRIIFPTTIRDPAAEEEFAQIAADYSWWAFMNESEKQTLSPSAADRLDDIRVPTLIVTAEHDLEACQEVSNFMHASVPDSRLIILTGTGHLMHMEQPTEFQEHLTRFLRSLSRR